MRHNAVEDASDACVRLRDYVDVCNCANLPAFAAATIHQPYNARMRDEAFNRLKISPVEA
jgi:hypothetical protein